MVAAIIVAAGRGRRMGGRIPKQYLRLKGLPLLGHSLHAFDRCPQITRICLVVPPHDRDFCRRDILGALKLRRPVEVIGGGDRRQDSVYRGLQALQGDCLQSSRGEAGEPEVPPECDGIVLIHDGVRPFVSPSQIAECIRGAREMGACIPAVAAADTLKQAGGDGLVTGTIARDGVWLAQTPQAFRFSLILRAHESARREGVRGTDDALLVERLGSPVKIVTGSRLNIKITHSEDLSLARAILDAQQTPEDPRAPGK